jgi:hypothetical protein
VVKDCIHARILGRARGAWGSGGRIRVSVMPDSDTQLEPIPPTRVLVSVPENLRVRMDEYAYLVGLSRSSIVRIALAQFFERLEKAG